MRPYYYIMGILSFLVGILCLVNPFGSYMVIGLLVSVFLLLVGFFYIMIFIVERGNQVYSIDKPVIGIAGLLLGIALVLISVLSAAVSSIGNILDMVILLLVSVWMIFNGIITIFTAMSYRKVNPDERGLDIAFGAVVAAAGIYGLLHLVIFREALGVVFGILLLLYGVNLICGAFHSE